MSGMSQSSPSHDGAWRSSSSATRFPEAFGVRGMVASAHPVAAAIGASVPQQGGNAVDAAIAVGGGRGRAAARGVRPGRRRVRRSSTTRSRREATGFNGSGVAGANATRERYAEAGLAKMPLDGIHSVSVPGGVGAYETIWKRSGRAPGPSSGRRRSGWPRTASCSTRRSPRQIGGRANVLGSFEWSARPVAARRRRARRPGTRWAAPEPREEPAGRGRGRRRDVLSRRAGRADGRLPREGGRAVRGGRLRRGSRPEVYTPIRTTYRDVTVLQTAPVSQGFLMLEQLNILEGLEPGGARAARAPTGCTTSSRRRSWPSRTATASPATRARRTGIWRS